MPSSHSDPDPTNSKIQFTSKLDIQNEYLHERLKDTSTGQVKVTEKVAPHQSTSKTTVASNPDGIGAQVWIQLKAVVLTIVWSGVVAAVAYKIVDLVVGLRVTEEEEREGLDISAHGETAYHN